jgi:hypothetical protein
MARIRSSPANKSQKQYWHSECHNVDPFPKSGSCDVVMVPVGKKFNWDFFHDEIFESAMMNAKAKQENEPIIWHFCAS